MDWNLPGSASMDFSRHEYWTGLPSLLQVISLTQGTTPGLLHRRQIPYHLIHEGSPQLSIFLKFFIIKCCGEIWAVVISEYVLQNDTSTPAAQRGRRWASERKDLGRPLSWEIRLPLFILLDLTLLRWIAPALAWSSKPLLISCVGVGESHSIFSGLIFWDLCSEPHPSGQLVCLCS